MFGAFLCGKLDPVVRLDLTFTLVFVARVALVRSSGGIQDSGSRPCATSRNACDRCAWARAGHHAAFIASGGAHLALQSDATPLVYPRQIPQSLHPPVLTKAHCSLLRHLLPSCWNPPPGSSRFPARLTL
ncbi:hypothetical protein POSPLADRAFT_1064609 [Postia placenta MAD-698-R-SB12]|uniref:Uncharacterized protein n=1 Tax=Postia placenta MAD-698-R-SB12 TaxID=670580 RepID=A0A1X6NBY4_9APHY|nr:hypothetical protein POSPLADRAFT_1064609 [Postia placenta MAD-698-R-SB12]OSX66137.1 hypothetical protein POSPLADRAFT_1064609 [Postia placenta MAD-698-R-SB12]